MEQKPSFLRSTWEGIKGYFKGGIAGAVIGAVVIGGITAAVGAFAPETAMSAVKALGSNATALAGLIPGGAWAGAGVVGAVAGGNLFGWLGAISGAFTGVVRSRETPQIAPEHLVALGRASAMQGVNVGRQIERENGTRYQDAEKRRQANVRAQASAAVSQP